SQGSARPRGDTPSPVPGGAGLAARSAFRGRARPSLDRGDSAGLNSGFGAGTFRLRVSARMGKTRCRQPARVFSSRSWAWIYFRGWVRSPTRAAELIDHHADEETSRSDDHFNNLLLCWPTFLGSGPGSPPEPLSRRDMERAVPQLCAAAQPAGKTFTSRDIAR